MRCLANQVPDTYRRDRTAPQALWGDPDTGPRGSAPATVQAWIREDPPSWLSIHLVTVEFTQKLSASLDPGEHDSILLALHSNTPLIVIDDRDGVQEARRQGLDVIGTLGILDYAGLRGFLDLPAAIATLQRTNFRAAPSLIERLLSADAARTRVR